MERFSAEKEGSYYWLGFRVVLPGRGDGTDSLPVPERARMSRRDLGSVAVFKPYDKTRHHPWKLYRIPALLCTHNKTLLLAVEAREFDHDYGKTGITLRRSTDGGTTWKEEVAIVWSESETYSTPAFVQEAGGKVFFFYSVNLRGVEHYDMSRQFVVESDDDGATWGKTQALYKSTKAGPGNGIQILHGKYKGRLVMPVRLTAKPVGAYTLLSDDKGKTWYQGELGKIKGGEVALVEAQDGKLLVSARSKDTVRKWLQTSSDGGWSWTKPEPSRSLLEAGAACSLLRVKSAKVSPLLYSCPPLPMKSRMDHTARRKVTIRLSDDNGVTWPYALLVAAGASGYSSMASAQDGEQFFIAFESGKHRWDEEVSFARFTLSDVRNSPLAPAEGFLFG